MYFLYYLFWITRNKNKQGGYTQDIKNILGDKNYEENKDENNRIEYITNKYTIF